MPRLRTFLPMLHDPPSYDVSGNNFMAIKPQALLLITADWCGDPSSLQIQIDGKTLRGTAAATRQGIVHVLRDWVHEHRIQRRAFRLLRKKEQTDRLTATPRYARTQSAIVSIDTMPP